MDNKQRLDIYNFQLTENNNALDAILETFNSLPEIEDLSEPLNTYTTEVEEQEVTLSDIAEAIKNKVGYAEDLSDELTTQDEKITTQNTTVDDIIRVLNEKVLFGGEEMVKYSLGEREIGTWIDGKPIYRRVFELVKGTDFTSNNTSVNHNIENIDNIVNLNVMGLDTNTGLYRPIPWTYYTTQSNSEYYGGVAVDATKFKLELGKTFYTDTALSLKIVVEYTKTTD
jgi:hypothetical protein